MPQRPSIVALHLSRRVSLYLDRVRVSEVLGLAGFFDATSDCIARDLATLFRTDVRLRSLLMNSAEECESNGSALFTALPAALNKWGGVFHQRKKIKVPARPASAQHDKPRQNRVARRGNRSSALPVATRGRGVKVYSRKSFDASPSAGQAISPRSPG